MRYVDIDELILPDGWQTRADNALNELRQEINDAEAAAIAAGKSTDEIAAARKEAISKGLEKSAREKIWRDLSEPLKELTKGKCWYSESRNPMSDKNVDHFRPKGRVQEEPNHEGYWWLAFVWRNYRYASQWGNQRRNDKTNKTSGGKEDRFPLLPNSFRAQQESDDHDLEEIMLLDPTDPEDWKLLTFNSVGLPTPAKPKGTIEYERANISIEVYHLNADELVDDRRPLAGKMQRLIEELEKQRPKIKIPENRRLYKEHEKELLRAIRKDADYSAAALAYARAEIYTMKYGNQVKREWLEEILNSNL